MLGRAQVRPGVLFVDADDPRTHAQLTQELPQLLEQHNLQEFDRGVVMSQNRVITRTIAGHLHERVHDRLAASERVVGIRWESRRYRERECWAVWLTDDLLYNAEVDPITPATPELQHAAELLGLRLPAV